MAFNRLLWLFTLLYDAGIRVGEALSLLATDVDLSTDDEKIRVFGKGQPERTVHSRQGKDH